MTHIKHLLTSALALFVVTAFSVEELCAAEATFTVVLRDYEVEQDKKLVEAFDLTVTSLMDESRPLIRPSTTNRIHDPSKSTLTIEAHYKDVPEGEYEVWYWIPSLVFRNKPYMEKFQLLSKDHFRKKLEFSTRKVVLKFLVDAKVQEHIRDDEFPPVSITKIKDGAEEELKTLDYSSSGFVRGADKTEIALWLIPDGEYMIKFAPVWGRPMKVPFRIEDRKVIPEVITFSDENRVPRPIE